MMKYIHQTENWTQFTWDEAKINALLCQLNRSVGFWVGRLQNFGFDVDSLLLDTFTQDIVQSSEIEGVVLNSEQVRSSVARKLGVDVSKAVDSSH